MKKLREKIYHYILIGLQNLVGWRFCTYLSFATLFQSSLQALQSALHCCEQTLYYSPTQGSFGLAIEIFVYLYICILLLETPCPSVGSFVRPSRFLHHTRTHTPEHVR